MNESKRVLVEVFGDEIGGRLFGSAVKLSAIHNIDLDDVVQDMVIEALDVQKKYGFVHINTTVLRTKNALYAGKSGYRYGGNSYQSGKDLGEITLSDFRVVRERREQIAQEPGNDDGDQRSLLEFVSHQVEWDLRETFYDTLADLDADTQALAYGLMAGYSQTEIAESLGKSNAYVSIRKGRLQEAFGWAVAEKTGDSLNDRLSPQRQAIP